MQIAKHANIFSVIVATTMCVTISAFCADNDPNDPNSGALISLPAQAKKINHFAEAVYWPEFDLKNVQKYIIKPDAKRESEVTELIKQVIDPNYLPDKLPEKIHFLKGWREEGHETFVLQYEKNRYVIRVKNQVTHIQVTKTRRDSSCWITIVIQAKDKSVCVNKSSQNAIFNFTDQFLGNKIKSSAQNYSGITNLDGPAFMQMGSGYAVSYPVMASEPNIHGVCIWTDGRTVIIALQELRARGRVIRPPVR
jgi:hypothetical protein